LDAEEPLPRIARLGAAYTFMTHSFPTVLLADAVYLLNEREFQPSFGLESRLGLVSLRGGYKRHGDFKEFSIGTGIHLGHLSFDYAMAMVDNIEAEHKISVSNRFPNFNFFPTSKRVLTPIQSNILTPRKERPSGVTIVNRIYEVAEGDTWKSISKRFYGNTKLIQKIISANRNILGSEAVLTPGVKIIIP